MARAPWIVDSRRFANKIKNPNFDPSEEGQNSGITRRCPNCNHEINNNDLAQKWPGLPLGVKFDPSDQELLGHLAAQNGEGNAKPHPFIDEFIPTLGGEDGICYTHPEKLPGVKQDGSIRHFFHRTSNAYLRGTRKRRRINRGDDQSGVEVRWHKTGKTRPINDNGIQKGCKKIMVLYMGKSEKTNWVIHQYHLGNEEDERDSALVVSKVFYQQQAKNSDRIETHEEIESNSVTPGDPLTPLTSTPELPRHEKWPGDLDTVQEEQLNFMNNAGQGADFDMAQANAAINDLSWRPLSDQANERFEDSTWEEAVLNDPTHYDSSWLAGESQLRIDSQQDFETLFCDENLHGSSSKEKMGSDEFVPALAEHGRIEAEEIEPPAQASSATSCLDNIELDTPPDEVQNLDMQFNSQESLSAWTNGMI